MVQFIPRQPSTFEKIMGPLSEGLGNISQGLVQQKSRQNAEQDQQLELYRQGQALEKLGLSPEVARAGRSNPRILESLIGNQINQQNQEEKQKATIFEDEKNFDQIANTFGDKFAKIWEASPVGGRTELLKHAIDAKLRGNDINQLLSSIPEEELNTLARSENFHKLPENIPQSKNGKMPKGIEFPSFDKRMPGYTPKEWNEEKKTWRKENAPVFDELKTRIKNLKRDQLGVKSLNKLNETRKVGEGFEASLINPETGEFYGLAQLTGQVSPESQQWVKEIARFQNRAKDAFGSRVTNFDLQSYMKQFPGLLNSYEGRKRILEMMKINYKLDSLYDNALQNIYDHYGLSGIPQEEADKMAREIIKDESLNLETEFLGLDQQNEQQNQTKELTEQVLDFYLEKANNDPIKAAEMAKQDGYIW